MITHTSPEPDKIQFPKRVKVRFDPKIISLTSKPSLNGTAGGCTEIVNTKGDILTTPKFRDLKQYKGEIKFKDGALYVGQIYNYKAMGHGKLVTPNQTILKGNWELGLFKGNNAYVELPSGYIYSGNWFSDGADGNKGYIYHKDRPDVKERYFNWFVGMTHMMPGEIIHWTFSPKIQSIECIGERSSDLILKITYINGDVYKGCIRGKNYYGIGTYKFKDDKYPEKAWNFNKEDIPSEGKGIFYNQEYDILYNGDFGGKFEGFENKTGTITRYFNDEEGSQKIYEVIYKDGTSFRGEMIRTRYYINIIEGEGVIYDSNGTRFEGKWENQMARDAKVQFKDGSSAVCDLQSIKFRGNCKFTYKDGIQTGKGIMAANNFQNYYGLMTYNGRTYYNI